ncbi:MAG: hypothetical protein EZS28_038904 [Streblomastix strix]|uniref:Uncharacterized protein n=1 Tax=Streblomastix strix TaxID=222440 RepID=A0A5J4U5C6_9EUKA|nr:MAG: hypothetical protein EZS28_038904 [Streblomastix strix]
MMTLSECDIILRGKKNTMTSKYEKPANIKTFDIEGGDTKLLLHVLNKSHQKEGLNRIGGYYIPFTKDLPVPYQNLDITSDRLYYSINTLFEQLKEYREYNLTISFFQELVDVIQKPIAIFESDVDGFDDVFLEIKNGQTETLKILIKLELATEIGEISPDFNSAVDQIEKMMCKFYRVLHDEEDLTDKDTLSKITHKDIESNNKWNVKERYFSLLTKTPDPLLSEFGSEMKLSIALDHYCKNQYFEHKEINKQIWKQIPDKLSDPLLIIEDLDKTGGGKDSHKVYDMFLDLEDEEENKVLCIVKKNLNDNSLTLDSAYSNFEKEKIKTLGFNYILGNKKNDGQFNTVLSKYLYEAITYDNLNDNKTIKNNRRNKENMNRRIKYVNPKKIDELVEIGLEEKINQLCQNEIENDEYKLDTFDKIVNKLKKEFNRWVNKFQDIVLKLPGFNNQNNKIQNLFNSVSARYSNNIEDIAKKIERGKDPEKEEIVDILAQAFTESGNSKPKTKKNEENDDENEGE